MVVSAVIICSVFLSTCGTEDAMAAPFQDLGFESVVTGTTSVGWPVPVPNWTSNIGEILYDSMALDSVWVSVHDGLSSFYGPNFQPIQGRYTVMLQDGYQSYPQPPVSASISQTGDVPSTARSLMFESDTLAYWGINSLQVTLNGTVVPLQLYSVGGVVNDGGWPFGTVDTYIADISAFAGDTNVDLQFTKLVQDPSHPNNHGAVDLDAIQFSSIIDTPEPSSLILLAIASLAASVYLFRRRSR
jgi:hypothetical protein